MYCVSEDAEYLEESYLGAGDGRLTTLRLREERSPDYVTHFAVTKEGCIPTTFSTTSVDINHHPPPHPNFILNVLVKLDLSYTRYFKKTKLSKPLQVHTKRERAN